MQENLTQILQQQLRDLQLPEQVGWWPLAIGWWILIALGLLSLFLLVRKLIAKRRRNAYRKIALQELHNFYLQWQQDRDSRAYLQKTNAVLKRSVLHFSESQQAASLSGEKWVDMLNRYARQELPTDARLALSTGCYCSSPEADIAIIHPHIRNWIVSHRQQSHA